VRTDERLAESLRLIAADAAPGRLPADLWTRGRRRRRARLAAGAAAAAVLVALAVWPIAVRAGGAHAVPPAEPVPVVPSRVDPPLPFTSTVQDSPHGPAALVVSGVGSFHGSDVLSNYEGRNVVVGVDGMDRLVNLANEMADAGNGTYLSPDGRLLATDASVEGVGAGSWDAQLAILDLTTGTVRTYSDAGSPLAWSPDGRSVLVTRAVGGTAAGGLRLVDLTSGESRDLGLAGIAGMVAFSPDGRRLMVDGGRLSWLVDLVTGERRELSWPGPARRLAGPGAWTADGRLAVVELVNCEPNDSRGVSCPSGPLPGLRISFVDAETGADASGPRFDKVTGMAVRLLGFEPDGSAVVAVFQPPPAPAVVDWQPHDLTWVGGVKLLALHPGGGQTELVQLSKSVTYLDVARDLVGAGRFGGPAPSLPARWADWLPGLRVELTVLAVLVGVVVAISMRRRLRVLLRRPFAGRRLGSP
jgi:hypothetical protein